MNRLAIYLTFALLLTACSTRSIGDDSGTDEAATGSTSDVTTENTMATIETTSSEGDEVDTSEVTTQDSFIPDAPENPCGQQCDIWNSDDCPEGEKCTAVACEVGGSAWDSNVCREIQGDGMPGDPCMYTDGSGVSGNDTCGAGSMCWNVDADTGLGYCVGFCYGSPDNPMCDPGYYCPIYGDGVLVICLPNCDPLNPDCQDNELCIPAYADEYGCVYDGSDGLAPYGSVCQFQNSCNSGLYCIDGAGVPEPGCDASNGCCSPFCDLNAPNTCPGTGQECQPMFDPQPAGYEHVGVCAVPL